MSNYRWVIYIAIIAIGVVAAPSLALASGQDFGVFGYDSRMAHRQANATIMQSDDREICSVADLRVVDQAYAEMFKLREDETCSDNLFVNKQQERTEEVCKFTGLPGLDMEDFQADYQDTAAVLVSLDLGSYRMNSRAELAVNKNLSVFSKRIPKTFSRYLSRSSRYVRMMKGILREEGVPEDMVYLALIESGFNTHAYSPSRASGPWQFMKRTGKRYGLKINDWVDERRDPVKSTYAAANYLTYLHNLFDSWSLAMAAYNAGEGRIGRALKSSGSHDYWSLIGTRYIKPETQNYVPKFIAARIISVYPEQFGFVDIPWQEDFVFDEVVLKKQMKLSRVAKYAGTTEKVIKELNPELRRDSTPPVGEYRLRVPRGSRELFVSNAVRLSGSSSVEVSLYRVEDGDDILSISHKTGVPGATILAYNMIESGSQLEVGRTLILPFTSR